MGMKKGSNGGGGLRWGGEGDCVRAWHSERAL